MNSTDKKLELIKNLTKYEYQGKISYNKGEWEELKKKSIIELENQWNESKKTQWYHRTQREVEKQLLMKERGEATELIVNFLKEFYKFKTTRSDIASEIWIYKKGIYLPEGKTYIEEITRGMLKGIYTSHLVKNVVDKIEADTYIDQDDFFEEQNNYPYLIPVQNGLLNLKTKELDSFNPEIAFFNKLSMKYNPESKCPNIIKFITEITGKEEDVKVIQEIFGYSLIKEYKYEKAFMMYGSHGRNGKSKLLELQKRLVGVENTASISLQDIEKDQFSMGEMHNKLVNISADISKEAINNTGNFKSLTGRDPIMAARKFKNRLKFVNYAKMIFAANELPHINDSNSDAFWQRWVIIDFPHQFLPEKEIVNNPLAKIQDPEIIQKITTPEEMEGLLVWSLEGLDRLESNKDFSNKETAKEVKLDWMKKSNSVAAFIYDNIVADYDGKITKNDFKKEYIKYCKNNRLKILSDKVIKITLENELNASSTREQLFLDGFNKQIYYWDGISYRVGNLKNFQ